MESENRTFTTIDVAYEKPLVYLTLNRPEARNAMNQQMVAELTEVFVSLKDNRSYRIIVLSGAGGFFCAGGDIKEMRDAFANQTPSAGNAGNLDTMLRACNEAPQVVIAKIEGGALGGGLGLACCSDIAVASENAKIGMPEVRLGVAPSFISPFVIQRIGLTRARELMVTGRRFNGHTAKEYGIVTEVCATEEINAVVEQYIDEVKKASANAIAATKEIIFTVMDAPLEETVDYRGEMLDTLRHSPDGQEGLLAFMQKRPPRWAIKDENKS